MKEEKGSGAVAVHGFLFSLLRQFESNLPFNLMPPTILNVLWEYEIVWKSSVKLVSLFMRLGHIN